MLEEYTLSIQLLEEILRRFPKTDKEEEILIDLVYNYKKTKNTQQSNHFLALLNEKYPDSEKAGRISGKQIPKPQTNENRTYEEIYRLFQSGDYLVAAEAKKKADAIHGNKYWTPQLLYIEAISQLKQQNDSLSLSTLNYIETNFPSSDMKDKVANLKNVITRRKEIESYLESKIIKKEEEKILSIPYEDAPVIEPMNVPYKISTTTVPLITKLPVQLIRLEKPRAGIEMATHAFEKKKSAPDFGIIKKAGTDSLQLKPVKQEIVSMVYIYNTNEPYYMLLVFEDIDQVYRSEARIAFQRYNDKARGGEDITLQLYEPSDGSRWLEIGPFPAMASSLGYYDEAVANIKSIIPWLATDKYQLMIISEKNLEIFKTRKDISEYLLFIRQYIKGKF